MLFNGYCFIEICGFYYLLIFCTLYVNDLTVSPANKNSTVAEKKPKQIPSMIIFGRFSKLCNVTLGFS